MTESGVTITVGDKITKLSIGEYLLSKYDILRHAEEYSKEPMDLKEKEQLSLMGTILEKALENCNTKHLKQIIG